MSHCLHYGDSSAVIACIKREQWGVCVWNWVQEISVTSKELGNMHPLLGILLIFPVMGALTIATVQMVGGTSIPEVATRELAFWRTRARCRSSNSRKKKECHSSAPMLRWQD
jgi:hypothetical protein